MWITAYNIQNTYYTTLAFLYSIVVIGCYVGPLFAG